eukprot:gene9960-13393_t
MDIVFSVENFEENGGLYREINSPRTLEACLRSGLDPAELYPKKPDQFISAELTKQMVEIKFNTFEKKRQDKIQIIKSERNSIIQYAERKLAGSGHGVGTTANNPVIAAAAAIDKSSAMVEMEEKRMEALRRRQEKELSKIVEREQTMAALQLKIKRAEEEEIKKKKIHDKKVAELKLIEEKKKQQIELEVKRKLQEENHRKKELLKKEAEVEEKLKKRRLIMERELAQEARMRDEERKQKIEEHKKKTELLIKAQEDLAEQNRVKMIERETRIMSQLEQKKEDKRIEVQMQREKAAKRIDEALLKHHELYEQRRIEFNRTQKEAAVRAKEAEIIEREKLKKQAEDREKRNTLRVNRLVDAYKQRSEHRKSIVDKRLDREKVYETIKADRDAKIAMMKFSSDLKLQDKLENVERVSRVNEFHRLQILQRIEAQDMKYEQIQAQREELMRKHRDESKHSLIRKHEISSVMDTMRMTNDFTLLDKLFATKSRKKDKRSTTAGGHKLEEGLDNNDERFAQTV